MEGKTVGCEVYDADETGSDCILPDAAGYV